ncbi:Arginine--tRNA ligase [Clavibacter michiganensis subsp. michiganensis]|uniref:Arginine--tRNA ligase n=1 Tax=Clavibacter michiganensis subsp. michiganensis TaxID=33013 RepID=A0A251XGJ5_CLAMM|nr:Arginine--tRNA ligase [Clavibacter michiganensis subsp. michiganensis]OUE01585.1 Arginine--tRNA ligase [Clavibacter michiganensis subsp. michiganensis]
MFRSAGTELMFGEIKQKLHDFGVDFDVFFHEDSLHESGAVDRAVARLKELGHVFEEDGAVWLRTTTFGDDRDRVVIRSTASPPTSRATSATTSTSASAASSRTSSCWAPTTTATSAA